MEIIEKAKHDTAAGSNPKNNLLKITLMGQRLPYHILKIAGLTLKMTRPLPKRCRYPQIV